MFTRLRHRSALVANPILSIVALLEFDSILQGVMLVATCFALSLVTGEADAETLDDWSDDEEVTYESDRHWYGMGVKLLRSSSAESGQRVALRDGAYYQTSSYPLLVQTNQPGSTTGDTGLPTLPPPTDQPQPAIAPEPANGQLPLPPQPNAGATQAPAPANSQAPSLSGELKKTEAEEKKKEKPAIPDLAKGILIASNDGDLTFKPGLRIQPRYMFDSGNDNNDFFIRRFRIKGSGSAYGIAKYGVEMKIDNEGRFGVSPAARAENAWLDFPVEDDVAYLRCGLFDLPMSRDALTSDSKLLFMDRTLIKEQLTAVGMADNTYGVMLHGRPNCGRWEYAVGIFDNDQFERFGTTGTRESDELMPAGRVVLNLLDPMKPADGYADYMESYIGKGERLELGMNASHLGHGIDGLTTLDLTAWGVDLFANKGHWTFQTEYDQIVENIAGTADIISEGWYAQAGYLFNVCDPCAEFCVRYEQLDPIIGDDNLNWVRIGMNFYIREHNLKVQTDYCIRSHNTLTAPLVGGLGLFDENVFEVQLQLDF